MRQFFWLVLTIIAPMTVHSDETYDHFASLESPDVATAFCNLLSYNQKLNTVMSKSELSTEDMVKIHELTYTLENAIARLSDTLKDSAAALEEVHLASERLDQQMINTQGTKYKQLVDSLLASRECSD